MPPGPAASIPSPIESKSVPGPTLTSVGAGVAVWAGCWPLLSSPKDVSASTAMIAIRTAAPI